MHPELGLGGEDQLHGRDRVPVLESRHRQVVGELEGRVVEDLAEYFLQAAPHGHRDRSWPGESEASESGPVLRSTSSTSEPASSMSQQIRRPGKATAGTGSASGSMPRSLRYSHARSIWSTS